MRRDDNLTIGAIERRITALEAKFQPLPTFEQFKGEWERIDELSKSLYETALSCPELVGADGKYWETISSYLRKMGVEVEPITLEKLLEELESDT